MSDVIDGVLSRRSGAERLDRIGLAIRRGAVCVLLAVVVVALCNVFGQRSSTATASSDSATLSVRVPQAVRPGLLYQGRISITARVPLPKLELALSHDWIDGLTMNTNEPSASTETSGPGGSLVFDLGSLQAGHTYVDYFEYQVNPTSFGRRDLQVTVISAGATVASLNRGMTIFP